uniref:(northern house mosquito) hypothetical protein n=1 Tax=Culex pipiens TaxID=7175 RepID=A0A8D8BQ25_CULPI
MLWTWNLRMWCLQMQENPGRSLLWSLLREMRHVSGSPLQRVRELCPLQTVQDGSLERSGMFGELFIPFTAVRWKPRTQRRSGRQTVHLFPQPVPLRVHVQRIRQLGKADRAGKSHLPGSATHAGFCAYRGRSGCSAGIGRTAGVETGDFGL